MPVQNSSVEYAAMNGKSKRIWSTAFFEFAPQDTTMFFCLGNGPSELQRPDSFRSSACLQIRPVPPHYQGDSDSRNEGNQSRRRCRQRFGTICEAAKSASEA